MTIEAMSKRSVRIRRSSDAVVATRPQQYCYSFSAVTVIFGGQVEAAENNNLFLAADFGRRK
jgi:hypothetical protein